METVLLKRENGKVYQIADSNQLIKSGFKKPAPFHVDFNSIKSVDDFERSFKPLKPANWKAVVQALPLSSKGATAQSESNFIFDLLNKGALALRESAPEASAQSGRATRNMRRSAGAGSSDTAVVEASSGAPSKVGEPPKAEKELTAIQTTDAAKVSDDATEGAQPVEETETKGCPISMISGEELLQLTDGELPGPIPFKWERTYRSGHARDIGLGCGWTHSACETLQEYSSNLIVLTDTEGRTLRFKRPKINQSSLLINEGLRLKCISADAYLLSAEGKPNKLFHRLRHSGIFLLREIHHSGYVAASSHSGKDAFGYKLKIVHNANSRVVAIESNWGKRLLLKRNGKGQITKVWLEDTPTGEKKLVAAYEYDSNLDLVAQKDESGNGEQYQYHNHLFKQRTLATGFSYYYEWTGSDTKARCKRTWGDNGIYEYHFYWDPKNNKSSAIDSRGKRMDYQYNEFGQITREVDAEGGVHQYEYVNGRKTAYIDPNGAKTRYTYDSENNLIGTFGPDGPNRRPLFSHSRWYFNGRVTKINNNGAQWRRDYNQRGLICAITAPNHQTTEFLYNDFGLLTEVQKDGQATKYKWNEQAELTTVIQPSGHRQVFQYNPFGQIIRVEYWLNAQEKTSEINYQYNDQNQVSQITYPNNEFVSLVYNANGQVAQVRDRQGRITRYEYDGLSQVVKRIDSAGNCLEYEYDTERNLIALINENGDTYKFDYDGNERLIGEVGFDGRLQRYFYDAAGHLLRTVDADEVLTDFARDPLGRMLTRKSYRVNVKPKTPAQKQTRISRSSWEPERFPLNLKRPDTLSRNVDFNRFAYDASGQLVECFNANQLLQFSYDALGRPLKEQHCDINNFNKVGSSEAEFLFEYTRDGQLAALGFPDGQWVDYSYDKLGLLKNVDFNEQSIATIQRDEFGRETARQQGALNTFTDYDPSGRLARQRASNFQNKTTPIERRYQYDEFGNLNYLKDGDEETRYVYDKLNRLVSAEGAGGAESFVFDPASNLLSTGDGPGRAIGNRLRIQGDRKLFYDARGNLIQENRGKEGKIQTRFSYNVNNQLVKTIRGEQVTEYRYDPLGRRIEKKDSFGSTRYLWAGDQMLQESRGHINKTYIYEPQSFRPLALVQDEKIYHYHVDQIGTPRELTNEQGEIVWKARYKTYGNVAVQEVEEVENNLRFQGQYFDDETGLHYNRHRYYNPNIGQFTTQDPIGLLGGVNNYQYAPNPVGWIDPFGLSCREDDSGRPLSSSQYSVYSEAQLKQGIDYPGRSDKAHFQSSNKQLYEQFQENPDYAEAMEAKFPGINQNVQPGPRGAHSRAAPHQDLTWHHHPEKEGVMQLVPKAQHQAPGPVQNTLHPNGKGGMENWGGGRNKGKGG